MKSIIRSILFSTLALYLVVTYIPGVKFSAGYEYLFIGGAGLTVLTVIVRPLLKILFLPINLVTLGAFSGLINVLLIYLLTHFFDPLSIQGWTFAKFEYQGFTIPQLDISTFWTYVLVSAIISLSLNALSWLCD